MQARPTFSIVIPTCDRPRQLSACLQAIARLDYRRDGFEVIVVNDGGRSPSDALVTLLQERLDVKLLVQAHAGPSAARNLGAAQAKGRFLVFTDDDCVPSPDWLSTLAARFAKSPDSAVGGRTPNALPGNPYSTASQLLVEYLYGYYNADPFRARFLASNNLALPAASFHGIGGFRASWKRAAAEDRELCDRWLHNGFRMAYAAEAVVYHAHALTFRTFLRQHFSYGRGAYWFHRVRAARGQSRVKLEPLRFYRDLVRYPFVRGQRRQAPLLTALLVCSQFANVAGYFWERHVASANER